MECIFSAQGLTKIYKMGEVQVAALSGIDLDLYEGEVVVILGSSGSGKSTFLNILGGLDTPTSGKVRFRDHQLVGANDQQLTHYRREHVGFVFQFYNLVPTLTALENVQLVTDLVQNPMPAEDALKLVGMADRLNHYPSQLSGGEQQRVAIARAIAKKPDVLLCDEPTGALDIKTGQLVLEALLHVNQKLHTTLVIITHNVSIASLAHRVIYLADGKITNIVANTEQKSPRDILW